MSIRSIDPSFHVTGQIKPSQLAEIAGLGFKTVICMRPDKEGFLQPSFDEIAVAARDAGLTAHYLPVVPGSLSFEQAQRLKGILTTQSGPILAYCASGQRCATAYEMAKRVA
ncbi:MAG: TIGR01244 family sulfur transferase [Rhizobium sp.]|nr:TIGR01244 family sulfur transferase [Rhizobium sp.]